MSMHDDLQAEQPPKRGMSSTAKVLLVLGSIAGVCLLLCCGGGAFFVYKAKDMISMTDVPQEIKQRTEEIAHVEVVDEFKPIQAMKIAVPNVMTMKWVIYAKGEKQQSILMLMEMNKAGMAVEGGAGAKRQRDEMLEAMRQQQGGGKFNTAIKEESTETRVFTINGEKVEFDFIKGTRPGAAGGVRQVVGVFSGKAGVVMFMLIVDESDYDETAVVKMIKSIRLPGQPAANISDEPDVSDEPGEPSAEKTSDDAEEMESETESKPEPASP